MSLYNVTVENVVSNPTGGPSNRWLETKQIQASKHEIIDGTLYLYTHAGDIIHYSKYYWRKVEKIE